jgi:branched-chain amino acid transport system ATP-binding protein
MAMLEVKNLHTYYGNIHALKGVSLAVDQGEVVTLIGGNGAGKTTLLNTISGLLEPRQGSIWLEGKPVNSVPAHEIVGLGISQCPEGRRVFGRMTVRENLEMGSYIRDDSKGIEEDLRRVHSLFPVLKERTRQVAGTLSGGEQQMLSMGRAMMSRPKLLLLDEPSMGLAPMLVETIFDIIRDINEQGTTVLLVEQNAAMALSVADRAYVLETGTIALEGTAEALLANPRVKEIYLGETMPDEAAD